MLCVALDSFCWKLQEAEMQFCYAFTEQLSLTTFVFNRNCYWQVFFDFCRIFSPDGFLQPPQLSIHNLPINDCTIIFEVMLYHLMAWSHIITYVTFIFFINVAGGKHLNFFQISIQFCLHTALDEIFLCNMRFQLSLTQLSYSGHGGGAHMSTERHFIVF